tara:strand:- start:5137 stop:5376 length:240 start_codon:yes stop_codon:yes gene_type:complete
VTPNIIQKGDLVRSIKYRAIGIVVDIFADLDEDNPWYRIHFTSGTLAGSSQWCKLSGLEIMKKGGEMAPLLDANKSGSL